MQDIEVTNEPYALAVGQARWRVAAGDDQLHRDGRRLTKKELAGRSLGGTVSLTNREWRVE